MQLYPGNCDLCIIEGAQFVTCEAAADVEPLWCNLDSISS